MPGDPNFTSGSIISYNGNSERGWNDPPTLSFNSHSTHNNKRRGKLDLRKRVAHDQALTGAGQVVQQPGFPVKGVNNDLSKGMSNLQVSDPRSLNNQMQQPGQTTFNQMPPVPPPPFYNHIHHDAYTTTTPSLPNGPIPTAVTQPTHPLHASSLSTIPQMPPYDPAMPLGTNLIVPPGFHRSVSEPNFSHPVHDVSTEVSDAAELPTSPPGIRSKADLSADSDHAASHIGQPLVKTYNPLMIPPLVPIPTRQMTPPLAKPITTQPAIISNSRTPFNSPQVIPPSVVDHVHDEGRRSSSPGIQPLLNGTVCRSETTSPAHPLPHGTPPLSRSEGSSPRSASPKVSEEFVDDGKTSEERKNVTMEVLVQALESHRESLKKSADDISRKLELMNQRWSSGKLSETTQRKLYKLALALQQHNHSEADKIHLSIIVDHVSEVTQFMVAIKKLVVVTKSAHNEAVL